MDKPINLTYSLKSIEFSKLKGFKNAGVNRLSLGIQSFNSDDLKILGRDHTGLEALKALSIAKELYSKERVSFDLIYARPGQTIEGILYLLTHNSNVLLGVLIILLRLEKGIGSMKRGLILFKYIKLANFNNF